MDRLIIEFDLVLRTLLGSAKSARVSPADQLSDDLTSAQDKARAGALMRVNHVGEICAQALYQAQALASQDKSIQKALQVAAQEEIDHLAWTESRIRELGTHKSVLNPLWYLGSLCIGGFAGALGARNNLGFLAETERQVERHLESHLHLLPISDTKSRAIVQQMKEDEARHAESAVTLGASELPRPVKQTMRLVAACMTRIAYYV